MNNINPVVSSGTIKTNLGQDKKDDDKDNQSSHSNSSDAFSQSQLYSAYTSSSVLLSNPVNIGASSAKNQQANSVTIGSSSGGSDNSSGATSVAPPEPAVTYTTIGLDATKSDFIGKITSFSKNGIHITFEDPDHTTHTPGTITWIDTGQAAPGFGIGGNGNKNSDTGAENIIVNFDAAADLVEISLVDHGTINSNDSITFHITQENGDVSTVTLTLDSNAPEKVTTFSFDSDDYGDGASITQVTFYSTSNLGGGHGEASFLIGGIQATYGEITYPDPSPAPSLDSPVFIVANNTDDVESSQVQFIVSDGVEGNDFGAINGGNNSDILVGDAGGAYTLNPPPVDFNVVMMLDVSGSMYSTMVDGRTRLDHLVDAVENLLADFNSYDNGDIMVHLVPFDTTAWGMDTFTVTHDTDFNSAVSFLNNLSPGGVTNYESALKAGISWLQSNEPIQGAVSASYFVSDGYPNYAIDDATGSYIQAPQWTWDGTQYVMTGYTAMEEILGADGSDEVAQIHSLSDEVIGVGINIGSSITNLDQIDSDGSAINVTSPDQLSQAFEDSNPLNKLDPIGDDLINGGDGDDIIFGDALYTDDLADLHGLNTMDGAGWEVFAQLESGFSIIDSSWTRSDTINYLKAHGEELMVESIDQEGAKRIIGNDTLNGGEGDDYIFGQEGNDLITGGEGQDTLYGGRGSDVFIFEAIADGYDIVKDYSYSEGDVLDISQLISNYDPLQDTLDEFVFRTESGGNTVVSVDVTGSGDQSNAIDLVVLEGIIDQDISVQISSDILTV